MKRIPAAMQASATSIMGMPTMPKITGTSRETSAEAIRCAPVCWVMAGGEGSLESCGVRS